MSIKAGQTATIFCENKKMLHDIVVVFNSQGILRYNDSEQKFYAGQIVTLRCANKKMKSNVLIALPSPITVPDNFLLSDNSNLTVSSGDIFRVKED